MKVVRGILYEIVLLCLGKGIIGIWYNLGLLAASGYMSRNKTKLPAVAHLRGRRAATSRSRLPH